MQLCLGNELASKRNGIGWREDGISYDSKGRLLVTERVGHPSIVGDPLSDYSRFTPVDPTMWK